MNGIQQFDFSVLNFIDQHWHNPVLDFLMPAVSSLADNGYIWIFIALLLLIIKKEKRDGLTLSLALLFSFIFCNLLLKPLVHRPRPYELNPAITLLVKKLSDFSFPSGHTSISFAASVALYAINKKWGIAAFILSAVIAFSRLYLYVHFPTDVLAGALVGTMCGLAAVSLLRRRS